MQNHQAPKQPHIVVTGARDYPDEGHVREVLNALEPARVTVGDASGVDEYTRKWCEDTDTPVTVYTAEWKEFGRRAGPIRNQRMLKAAQPDYLLAFPGGPGTKDCVQQAQKMALPVVRAIPEPDDNKRGEW